MKLLKTMICFLGFSIVAFIQHQSDAQAMGKAHGTDPEVVHSIDLDRYLGDWYEIAHAPNWFQRKCMRSLAHYEKIDATHISVLNTCLKENGRKSTISGYASVPDVNTPAKLLVKFKILGFIPVKGDYWIVDLGQNYEYAVVSGAGKNGLFILSREVPMKQEKLAAILTSLKDRGFYTDNLVYDLYDL